MIDDRGGANPTRGLFIDFKTAGGNILYWQESLVFAETKNTYHLVVTYDGVSQAQIYVDGVSLGLGAGLGGGGGALVPANATMTIGSTNSTGSFLKGVIGDLQLHNRALTQSEVTQAYNGKLITKI